jgi:hypothetical protein
VALRYFLFFALIAGVALLPAPVQAAEFELVVHAGPTTNTCPDRDDLQHAFAAAGGQLRGEYGVSFARLPLVFHAVIFRRGRERVLEDVSCERLGRAVVAALIVMSDEELELDNTSPELHGKPRSTSKSSATDVQEAPVYPPPQKKARRSSHISVDLAPIGATVGIVRPAALSTALRISYGKNDGLRVGLMAHVLYPGDQSLGRGRVVRNAFGGALDACVPLAGTSIRLHTCAFAALYQATAEARGFLENASATQYRFSVGPAIDLDHSASSVASFWMRASVDFPIIRESFNIVGAGIDYQAPPVAGNLLFGVRLRFL